ncbi:urea amidolyase family protein [Rothia sp. ARF10]|nr:urea amidolyase family protein [Rothia sp. ARF10]
MPVDVRLLPMGESAWLVETDDLGDVLALESALRPLVEGGVGVWADVDDLVPAARTLLVVARATTDLDALATEVRRVAGNTDATAAPLLTAVVEVPVRYDGPDLDDVATRTGLSREQVVAAHTGTPWRVAFGGFAPGFAYLVGGDPRLVVPRRAEPRTRVPAGAVGLAGEFTGIYPRESPGGWQLVGTTDLVLWDADRDPPALLTPGTTVRFTLASGRSTVATQRSSAQPHHAPPRHPPATRAAVTRALEVLDPGPLTLVEDLGRVGHAAVGVGRSGATDVGAFLLGNRLLGNTDTAPGLEATLGGLRLRAHGDVLVCLTGATAPVTVDGRPVAHASLVEVRDGQELSLGVPAAGLRTYVGVRGGLDVPLVLGSASADTMSGLGPRALRAGQVLAVGSHTTGFPVVDAAVPAAPALGPVELDVLRGPRWGWFADPGQLARTTWTVSTDSDRRGVRLEGAPLVRRPERQDVELPSEGMVRGAIQVPPNGLPVLLLNDHPVTGGYPVIGVVRAASVDRAAQLQPGQPVRFRWR